MPRVIIGLVLAAVFIAVLVRALSQQANVECEVCIDYNGNSACRTNLAIDRERALLGATSSVCAIIGRGVTQGIQCSNTPPSSVRCSE